MAAYAVVMSALAQVTTAHASAVVHLRDTPAGLEISVHLAQPDVATLPVARDAEDIEVADRVGALEDVTAPEHPMVTSRSRR